MSSTPKEPVACIFGDDFRANFWTWNSWSSYLGYLPLVFSLIVYGRTRLHEDWSVFRWITLLIFLQGSSELVFATSFVCTTSTTLYIQQYGLWNFWYAVLMALSSAQGVVDLIWIYKYDQDYLKDRYYLNKRGNPDKLEEADKQTKK